MVISAGEVILFVATQGSIFLRLMRWCTAGLLSATTSSCR